MAGEEGAIPDSGRGRGRMRVGCGWEQMCIDGEQERAKCIQ